MTDPDGNRPYTVVVGVSATSKSRAALNWAACQAEHCQGRLVAVRAWRMPSPPASPAGTPAVEVPHAEAVEAHARRALEEDVADVLGEDHSAEIRLIRGGKLKALLQASSDADLLVIDAPRQLRAGPMFAHRLIYAASCPVLTMPPVLSSDSASPMLRVAKSFGSGLVPVAGTAEHPAYRPPMRL